MEHAILRRIRATHPFWLCALAIGGSACGSSAPTHQLADARRAYDDAEDGPAKTQRPGELHAAKRALDRAEDAHDDDPGSNREKRLSEVAEHKAEVADERGEAAQAAKVERARNKDEVVVNDTPAPAAARPAADKPRASSDRANDALQHLTTVSHVRQDDRGVVITLSGELLFPSGQNELSPVAKQHLDEVADALREQPANAKFRVEGYTDASGAAKLNQQLSQKRARAVADYLSTRDIAASRFEVAGYGEQKPIADNDSDEGRASNRRVEVIIAK